jgi:hypothetical protein
MAKAIAAVLAVGLFLVSGSAWAQAPAAQQAVQGPGARFVDANGDGVCDNLGSGAGFGRGAGRWGNGRGAGRMGRGMGGSSLVTVVSRTTGQDWTAVVTGLRSGKSLAQIAEEGGKSAQDVVDAVIAERAPAVRQAVSSGRLTQAQADQVLANMRQNVQDNLAGGWQARGRGMRGAGPVRNPGAAPKQ